MAFTMKLITLICIFVAIVIACLFCRHTEFFTPNNYTVSWTAPSDDGGEPITSYDWQICSDDTCHTVITNGTVPTTSFDTGALDWNTTYTVQVRANNMFGPGIWTSAKISTGDGVAAISIASAFDASGKIVTPLSVGPGQNIAIWTTLTNGSQTPNDFNASALVYINRGFNTILTVRVPMYPGAMQGALDTFEGDFATQGITLPAIQANDKVTAIVMVWDNKGNVQTESSFEFTVTQTTPSNVTGISLTYSST